MTRVGGILRSAARSDSFTTHGALNIPAHPDKQPVGVGSLEFLRAEFPDFPTDTLPDIPDSLPLTPSHWHNNACPSWVISGDVGDDHAELFIDYPAGHPSREMEGPRYLISTTTCETIAESDDWDEILEAIRVYQNQHGIPTDLH